MRYGEDMRSFLTFLGALFLPALVSAHEVYVLPKATIEHAIATPGFNEWQVIFQNIDQFVLWGFIAALTIFVVFFVGISRVLERSLEPLLRKLPPYAPVVSRITIALSFLAAAYYQALCGPELPLVGTFGTYSGVVTLLLILTGLMLLFGLYVRTAALIALALLLVEIAAHGWYMLTYTNYFGEIVLLLILGSHLLGFHDKHDDRRAPRWFARLKERLAPYGLLILRVAFGISLLYASLYAKIIHNQLALSVAYAYPPLVHFFGFEPHFLVLGAGIIEILIAVFFIVGFEIRFTSFFLLFWLSLSLWYFGEVVWPHLILIGIPIAFIFYGYDDYTLEGRFFKKGRRPVL